MRAHARQRSENHPDLINRLYGRWGLRFDRCRLLGGLFGRQRLVYSAAATQEFWRAWAASKSEVGSAGYNLVRRGRQWLVEREDPIPRN